MTSGALRHSALPLVDIVDVLELSWSQLLPRAMIIVPAFLPKSLRLALQCRRAADHALIWQQILVHCHALQVDLGGGWEPILVVVGDRAAVQEVCLLLLVVLGRRCRRRGRST